MCVSESETKKALNNRLCVFERNWGDLIELGVHRSWDEMDISTVPHVYYPQTNKNFNNNKEAFESQENSKT